MTDHLRSFAAAVGIEGAFIALGTALLALSASFIHPAVAVAVVGFMSLVIGAVLARPTGRAD
jgi:hypothetical protein